MTDYTDVCNAKSQKEMLKKFDAILEELVKEHGGSKEQYLKTQLSNVGYFAGYYDDETMKRVKEWLGAEHPIFPS